jgi:hypothetical protein
LIGNRSRLAKTAGRATTPRQWGAEGEYVIGSLTIVSGRQAGADRAALDWAIVHGIAHGGWCTKGRRAEDGPLDARYGLMETESKAYRSRTVRNVCDSDTTLIVNLGELEGGSLETLRIAERRGKPVRVVQVDAPFDEMAVVSLRTWLDAAKAGRLNVAGPRESKRPGIYVANYGLRDRLLGVAD